MLKLSPKPRPAITDRTTLSASLLIGAGVLCMAISTGNATTPTYRNLAKYQKAAGSSYDFTFRPECFATDGIASNFHRWRTTNTSGHTLDITYPRPVTIASAHLYSGVISASTTEVWGNFKFQYDNGTTWVDIPGGSVTGNSATERNLIFNSAVTSNKFRLLSTDSAAVRSVRELAMFGPNLLNTVEQGYPIGTEVVTNLAYQRPATASSIDGTNYAIKAVDGYVDDSSRWLCAPGTTGENLEIDLLSGNTNGDAYHAISSARLYSGDFATSNGALSDFTLQYWDTVNLVWVAIPGATITGNTQTVRTIPFSSTIITNKVRLINNTTGSAKVAELQIFPPSTVAYPAGQDVRMEPPPSAKWEDFGDATRHLQVSSAGLKLGLVGTNAIFTNDGAGADALNWQVLLNYRDGSYRVRNVKTGHCLALAQLSTAVNTAVVGETYTGMPHQCWFLDFVNGTQFRLINAYSGLALQSLGGSTTSGASLVVVAPGSSTLQQWDTVRQAHYPKKGIAVAGSNTPFIYENFKHASWAYNWGRMDDDSFMGPDQVFNPMQFGKYFYTHQDSTSKPPLEGLRPSLQSQGKPVNFMGFNEPDHTAQATMTVDQAISRWPRMQSLNAPLVGPCAAYTFGVWEQDFNQQVEQLGYRIDYTPLHWYKGPNSNILINDIKQVYALYGRPVWLTEFSVVRWVGNNEVWTDALNYNFLAEFMWRAENLPELARYSLFNWSHEPNAAIDPPEAPRGNSLDENGNLTPYGELYASWDGIAQVLPQKAYYLHNRGRYQRMRSPASGNVIDFVAPDISTAGLQWYLTSGTTPNTYRIQTTRDGRPLIHESALPAAMGSLGQMDEATEWTLVPVVSGENHDGWYYLENPLTRERLKNNADGTCSMVEANDTSTYSRWRFVVPVAPEIIALPDQTAMHTNDTLLMDVLTNDGGGSGNPTIQSISTPNYGTAVVENGKIRYTPPTDFSGEVQFTYTITDGTITTSTTVTISVLVSVPPTVDAGATQSFSLDGVATTNPAAAAYFEWNAAIDTTGDNIWASTTANTYDWGFDSGNQTPVDVTDARFVRLTKAYAFPAAKDAGNITFDALGSNQTATFEFVVDIDGANGSIFETGGIGDGMQVDVVNGVLRGTISETTPARVSYALTPTDLGRFIHVVFIADNANNVVKLYVDGELKDTKPWALGEDWAGTNDSSLGGVAGTFPEGGSDVEFTGKLALFRFYQNKAFTDAEVNTNLQSLIGGAPHTVTLNGLVEDADGDSLTTSWQVISGPDSVRFGDASAAITTASFAAPGTYVLRLTTRDRIDTVSDEVTITVTGNVAPTLDAGANQIFVLNEVAPTSPAANAHFAWDAANNAGGNTTWSSTTGNTYDWTFDVPSPTLADVIDARFASLTKAYVFPAAKDTSNTTFSSYENNKPATFEFVVYTDGSEGSIFHTGHNSLGMQLEVRYGALRGSVAASSTTAARVSYPLTSTDRGRFIHVVFVVDQIRDVIELYVDGQLKKSQAWTSPENWAGSTGVSSLGHVGGSVPSGGSTAEFTGKLALFRFYKNKSFTGAEVSANFSSLIGEGPRTVTLNGMVEDLDGDSLTTTWRVISGPDSVSFGNASAANTTASFTTPGTYILRLTTQDGISTVGDDVTITVLRNTPYNAWMLGTFSQTFTATDPSGNMDGDTYNNLQEFAFGTDPTSPAMNPLSYVPNLSTTGGSPVVEKAGSIYRAVFARRKDHIAAGLTYTVSFSADLAAWENSTGTPVRLSGVTADPIEAVSVDFPATVPLQAGGSAPPRFFRVGVSKQ